MTFPVDIAHIRLLSGPVWVSGQMQPAQLQALANAGFAFLVNHRPDGESPDQPSAAAIQQAAIAAGLECATIPISGVPGPAAVAATAAAIERAGDGKVLMFCRSGMRSAAAWAMAARAAGADRADVLRAAAAAGYDLGGLPL